MVMKGATPPETREARTAGRKKQNISRRDMSEKRRASDGSRGLYEGNRNLVVEVTGERAMLVIEAVVVG